MNLSSSNHSGGREAAAPTRALAEAARERAALYELLATLFRRQPNRDTLVALRTPELRAALAQAGIALPESFFGTELETLGDELAVAFADLFLVPGLLISPHESVQRKGGSGLLRGPETAAVRDYYDYVGFRVDESSPMEPDHVSIELEFVGHLAAEEAAAWEAGLPQRALDALRYQNDFLERHLGAWANDFMTKIEHRTSNAFYRQLAALTGALLKEQQALLPPLIAEMESRNDATQSQTV